MDPKDGFHDYKVDFVVKNEEATSVSMIIKIDYEKLKTVGIMIVIC